MGYIHDCPGVNIKLLFTRQPFQSEIQIYTRLPCVHIKSLFTRQPFKSQNRLYTCTLLPGVSKKIVIYTESRSSAKSAIYMAAGWYMAAWW